MTNRLSRREFIRVSAAGALLLSAACAPAAPSSGASSATSSAGGAAKTNPYPTYVPLANGPKPDYRTDDPRFDDGFDNYPANPIKAVADKPGAGGAINVLNRAYFPPPTPFDQNPTWQEISRQLNATMNINIVAGPDYQTKFVTTMASDDLPDIMHIYNGYALAPNLPAFFKAQDGISRASYVPWRYIAQHPYVNYQADLPWFAKAGFDAQQMLMPLGVSDPTDGYYSATAWSKGQTADVHFQDGVIDIILGRRQMSEYDGLVKAWQTEAGETVRKEFMDSMSAGKR